MNIPKTVFIIPYRNRAEHKKLFEEAMNNILLNMDNYKYIIYIKMMNVYLIEEL